jgi:hypothetical protein
MPAAEETFVSDMKIRRGRQSGTLDNTVSVDSKYGQVVRSKPRRSPRLTNARAQARSVFSIVSARWRTLTDRQYAAWNAAGRKAGYWTEDGKYVPMSGFNLFVKVNCVLATARLPLMMDPPASLEGGPNPVRRLIITNEQGQIRLYLGVARTRVPRLFVLGSPPCSPGISFRSNYAIIGLLPEPKRGRVEITEQYVNKFGLPPVGSRVFIQTRPLFRYLDSEVKAYSARVPEVEP